MTPSNNKKKTPSRGGKRQQRHKTSLREQEGQIIGAMSMRRPPPRPEDGTNGILQGQSAVERKMHSSIASAKSRRAVLMCLFAAGAALLCYVLLTSDDSEMPLEKSHVRKRSIGNKEEDPCTIWMAPSSVKGLDGYGIFTTRSIKAGSKMLPGPDGPSIPVIDYVRGPWTKTMNEYWWESGRGVPDHVTYEGGDRVMDFATGFSSMPNHNCFLSSLKHRYPDVPYDDSLINATSSPGTGAFSYSAGRIFVATRDLEQGDEIFLNYGYCNRGRGDSHGWPAKIPMREDYAKAADLVWAFLQLPEDVTVRIAAPKNANEFVVGLLPKTTAELREIVGTREIEGPKDLIPLLAKYTGTTPRTPDWIRSNGMCLERLTARKSNLPHAGQGAFAQHRIRKGEIVVPAPLIQIANKDVLGTYDKMGNRTGSQLFLNYCFGHKESTLLLCPETNALLINHCSDRKKACGSRGPNAMFQWSSGWEPRSDEWRDMTVDQISNEIGRGLSMEVVALRDIEAGEEVYMDYGVDWEQAWEKHVATWNPPPLKEEPRMTAKEANEQKGALKFLVTGDLRKVSNHSYLFTGCQYWTSDEDKDDVWYEENKSWVDMKDEDILHNYADDGTQFQGYYTAHSDWSHWPCTVIRQEDSGSYTVRIHQAHWTSCQTVC